MPSRPGLAPPYTVDLIADHFRGRDQTYRYQRPHGSGDWLLIYTDGGSGRIATSKGTLHTRIGDAVLFAPAEPQDYGTAMPPGKWDLLWAHFQPRPSWTHWLKWPSAENGTSLIHLPAGEIRETFESALLKSIRLYRRQLPHSIELAANALEEALLWASLATSDDPRLSMDPRVRAAADYLSNHLREPFDLEKLAQHCGASVSRLAHLFKEQVGTTPRLFHEQQRLNNAAQLLRVRGLSVKEAAAASGFSDPFYFANRFRRYTGKTPSQYRQMSS
jgi:AraC family transcriptional regulator of arabinose operon